MYVLPVTIHFNPYNIVFKHVVFSILCALKRSINKGSTSGNFFRVKEASYEESQDIVRKDNLESFILSKPIFRILYRSDFIRSNININFDPKIPFLVYFELFRTLLVTGSGFLYIQVIDISYRVLLIKTTCRYLISAAIYSPFYVSFCRFCSIRST